MKKLLIALVILALSGCAIFPKPQKWFNPHDQTCDSTKYDCKDVNHPERYQ